MAVFEFSVAPGRGHTQIPVSVLDDTPNTLGRVVRRRPMMPVGFSRYFG